MNKLSLYPCFQAKREFLAARDIKAAVFLNFPPRSLEITNVSE